MQETSVLSGCSGWLPLCFLFSYAVTLDWLSVQLLRMTALCGLADSFWFCISVVLVGFGLCERSLALKIKRSFSCLLCNLYTWDCTLLTSGSGLVCDLGETLPFSVACFLHPWQDRTGFSLGEVSSASAQFCFEIPGSEPQKHMKS